MKKPIAPIVFLLLIILIIMLFREHFLVRTKGMQYISASDKYILSNSIISGPHSVDLDLSDINGNKDKLIYEDSSCKVYINYFEILLFPTNAYEETSDTNVATLIIHDLVRTNWLR